MCVYISCAVAHKRIIRNDGVVCSPMYGCPYIKGLFYLDFQATIFRLLFIWKGSLFKQIWPGELHTDKVLFSEFCLFKQKSFLKIAFFQIFVFSLAYMLYWVWYTGMWWCHLNYWEHWLIWNLQSMMCQVTALFMWYHIYKAVYHKLNFRVILIDYEDHKIKYELFCVYCERFSGVKYSIENNVLKKENWFNSYFVSGCRLSQDT